MITPASLKNKLKKQYKKLLKNYLAGTLEFPHKPRVNLKVDFKNYNEALKQLTSLKEQSVEKKQNSFRLEYTTKKTRAAGFQTIPSGIYFDSPKNLFTFIGKYREVQQLHSNIELTKEKLRTTTDWFVENLALCLKYACSWEEIVDVTVELKNQLPRDLQSTDLRSIPLKQHSKFIENHISPIKALLLAVDAMSGSELKTKAADSLVAFRFYNSHHSFQGSQVAWIPALSLETLSLPRLQILIIENKSPFLANLPDSLEKYGFSHKNGSILIWGEGNGVTRLQEVSWLTDHTLFYWGDMDLHGLAILGRLKKHLPKIQSVAMNLDAYNQHKQYAVPGKFLERGSWYEHLNAAEKKLTDFLYDNPDRSRIEQERVL